MIVPTDDFQFDIRTKFLTLVLLFYSSFGKRGSNSVSYGLCEQQDDNFTTTTNGLEVILTTAGNKKSSKMQTSQKTKPIPYDNQNIIPYIMVDDVKKLINFLQAAFDAVLDYKLDRNDSTIMHAEVIIGNNKIMMGEPNEKFGAMPVSIYLYVADCDKIYNDALKAGATSIAEVKTMYHAGERYGCVKDFAGNIWWIATHIEDMTLEESQRRIKEMNNS